MALEATKPVADIRIRTAASFGVSVCLLIGYTVTRPADLMLLATVGRYRNQFGIQQLHTRDKDTIQSVVTFQGLINVGKNIILFVSLLHNF